MNSFLRELFCVKEGDGYRVSLTKTGAAIKALPVFIGGSLAGVSYFSGDNKAAIFLAVVSAAIAGVGGWIEDIGKRNAVK